MSDDTHVHIHTGTILIKAMKALAHYKDFHKDFSRKLLSIYKTVEKILLVVKQSGSVYER